MNDKLEAVKSKLKNANIWRKENYKELEEFEKKLKVMRDQSDDPEQYRMSDREFNILNHLRLSIGWDDMIIENCKKEIRKLNKEAKQ